MTVAWQLSDGLVPYPEALATMAARSAAIRDEGADELVWLVEHPPLYTAGTSARPGDLLAPDRFPVYVAGRGGQYTYHGPGQRVVYLMLDLKRRKPDVRAFVHTLESWVIDALARIEVRAERRAGRIGLWVACSDGSEAKIAALGVRLRRWVSSHGVAINVAPDLEHFAGIVPCGISDHGVASLAALGSPAGMAELDAALLQAFPRAFGDRPVTRATARPLPSAVPV